MATDGGLEQSESVIDGPTLGDVAARWRRDLESWAIPDDILRAAPQSPWSFPPRLFRWAAVAALDDPEPTPSRLRALDALPVGGSVLDVGAGAGAGSLPLAPPADELIAVDERGAMLGVFAEMAEGRGVRHLEITGSWPDVEAATPRADLVVCHHVLYNVADLVPFLRGLDRHARRRVVVELTAAHPLSGLAGLWLAIHGLVRPSQPRASDAAEVAAALGYDVHVVPFEHRSLRDGAPLEERVAFARRQLCVGPEHDAEISAYFEGEAAAAGNRQLVTLWWDTDG
jgi:hypothetical protein